MQFTITDADPDSPAALTCLRAYYTLLLENIAGLSPDLLTLPLADAASYRPPLGLFCIAWSGETPIGCVSLHPLASTTAEVKRLWVAPAARGMGLARRLMQTIESRAAQMGFVTLKLDSNSALTPAISLYRATDWHDCPAYTGFPADIWMSKRLG